jgi:hypothetical protein
MASRRLASSILNVNEGEQMKFKPFHFVLLAALLLGCDMAHGQDSLGVKPKKARTSADYKPRTLKVIAAPGPYADGRGNKEETVSVTADLQPSRVRATYTGLSRPLPQIKKEVIRQWARLYAGSTESYTEPYETEMLFTEDRAKYWLAVRKKSLPQVRQKLKRGELVDLYLIRVGAARTAAGWEPMLLIESFQKPN